MSAPHCERDDSEIEITPAMMEAGIAELALFDACDRGEWVVDAVYRAMRKVALRHINPVRIQALSGIAEKPL